MLIIRFIKKSGQFVQTKANYQHRQVSEGYWIYNNTEEYDVNNKKISHKFDITLPGNFVFFFSVDKIKAKSTQQKINENYIINDSNHILKF